MYLVGFALYVVVCGTLAWSLAIVLTRRAREPWVRWVVADVLAPIVFLLPLADEIVGYFQFERLCEEAKEAKIHGTIPVGEDLYTPEGKWRIRQLHEVDIEHRGKESFRLQKTVESYLRWEHRRLPEIHAAIEIWAEETKVYDAKSGRLLADYRTFGTNGGWFAQNVVAGEGPLIVRQGCGPVSFWEIQQSLLKFTKPSEAAK